MCFVQIIEPLMQPMVSPSTVPIHPVAALHERCQHAGRKLQLHTFQKNQAGEFSTEIRVDGKAIGG